MFFYFFLFKYANIFLALAPVFFLWFSNIEVRRTRRYIKVSSTILLQWYIDHV